MKALVTGGAGFIGSNIVKLLEEREYKITVYDNLSTGYLKNIERIKNLTFIKGDILDVIELQNAMSGVDLVFHLAANIGNVKSIQNPVYDSEVNVIGTLNVLESSRKAGVKKIVYSSSAAIYGEPKYQPIDESHPAEPDSPYGVSKLAGEKHCLCYSKIYNLEIVCLRYFNVYGINQRFDEYGNVIPIFTKQLLNKGNIKIYGDGEQTRDFINVKDVARANVLAAEKKGLTGAFNVGAGVPTSINHLSKMMLEITNSKDCIEYSERRKGEVLHSLASIEKARSLFDYQPKIDLETGLKEYINWFQSEVV
jgi:UDP-glucose 4-epimerase